MTDYFFDSSAVIKRHIVETGSRWIRSLVARESRNTILIAQVTQAEVVSGAMRRLRNGTISARTAHTTRQLLDARIETRGYFLIRLSDPIIQRAEDLLERHPLRAYDAIQLASAVEGNRLLLEAQAAPLIFVSADKRLLEAAAAEGLRVDDPNAHA